MKKICCNKRSYRGQINSRIKSNCGVNVVITC